MSITVNSLPQVSLATFNNLCDTVSVFQLMGGLPVGGNYSGNSVSNNIFNNTSGPGVYPITYSYTNTNGCNANAVKNLTVIHCTSSGLEDVSDALFRIYPNPVSDNLTIEIDYITKNTVYYIFDISGRLLMQGNLLIDKNIVDISFLSSGTYYIRIAETNTKLIKH
jgi:hypothetical protein